MPISNLVDDAAELLRVTDVGTARSLAQTAELAVRQVPGCSGANAALWLGDELVDVAATHPDAAALADDQLAAGHGPLIEAASTGVDLTCPEMLVETRWPEYAGAALRRGIRCSAHLVRTEPPMTLVLSLFGVRPGVLDTGSVPMADLLAAVGCATLLNATAYAEAQRTSSQLRDAMPARSVVDQAKGVLMHALGCDAADALRRLRQESQRRHVKVTEVARQVIAAGRTDQR